MAWVLPCDSLIKKIYNNLSYRPISWKGFLNYNSFLDDSSLYHIGNKTKTTGTGRKKKRGQGAREQGERERERKRGERKERGMRERVRTEKRREKGREGE